MYNIVADMFLLHGSSIILLEHICVRSYHQKYLLYLGEQSDKIILWLIIIYVFNINISVLIYYHRTRDMNDSSTDY